MAKTTTKKQHATAIKAGEVLTAAATLSLDGVTTKLAGTSLEIQKSLADIGTKLTARVTEFDNLGKACALKTQELKRLYDLEVAATTLEDLQAKITGLESEYAAQTAERTRQWKRSEEEYVYERNRRIRQEADEQKARLEVQERQWQARETALAQREKDCATALAEHKEFPQKLEAACRRAAADALAAEKSRQQAETALLRKDYETKVAVLETQLAARLAEIQALHKQVQSLETQVKEVNANAMAVAAETVKSASKSQMADSLQKTLESLAAGKQSK